MHGVNVARVAEMLVEAGALKLGEFRLSSGGVSRVYIDLRILPFKPRLFREAVEMYSTVAGRVVGEGGIDALAGVATGGIPWAIGLGLLMGMPATYVRSSAKDHGTSRLVEAPVRGVKVLVVDDVATTGASIARAVGVLRSSGARVEDAIVFIDREHGARELLASMGVRLHRVTTLREVLASILASNLLPRNMVIEALEEMGGSVG